MKRILKHVLMSIIAITVMMGGVTLTASAASADTNDFEFEVITKAVGTPTATTSLTNTQETTVGGATQVLWQDSAYGVNLTPTAVKAAWNKRIKVIATGSNSSSVIYRQSGHRQLVVLKPYSKVRNTGRHNNMRVGFVWTLTRPAIVKYDKASRQYRHAADLLTKAQLDNLQSTAKGDKYRVAGSIVVGGKRLYIVIWCGNYIGGNVPMLPNVTQVRFEQDILMKASAESVAKTGVTFDFKVTCPSSGATFNVQGFAWAYGRASSEVTFSQRTRATVIGALEYKAKQDISIDQDVEAEAQASVHISGSCGSTPPSYSAPSVSANASACVEPGQATGIVTVTATNNNDVAVPATFTFPGKPDQTATIAANTTVTKQFTGVAPGPYTGTVSFGAPVNKTAQYNVPVEECKIPPHQNPTAEIFVGEHAVDLYGTMPVFGRVKAFDGATATLGSPKVTPSDLGMISNWRTVSTERDGVTPCATGYVCYQGTFRVTKDGTPGTYVYGTLEATATDTKGGSFTTDPLQFSVYYANHPET